jgi:hypothetical protein
MMAIAARAGAPGRIVICERERMKKVAGRFRAASVIILIGLFGVESTPLAQKARREPPRGPVRVDRRAVADADGPFNALGATLFWGAWGYKFDRARLERNLAVLSDAGVDYVRVLGSVGGASWEDRQTDPRWTDYEAIVTGLTDLAFDKYGMRVQWTLFGGAPFTPPGPAREALVDRFAKIARGREHKIFAFEIANESRSTGFAGSEGVEELRRLGARLKKQTPVLVALSAPVTGAECATYAGAGVDVATMHYERGFGVESPLRPLLGPWTYPAAYDRECRGQLPKVVFNNEPIGPESSVREDDDPARIAAAYVLTFLANNAAYVLHAGPGIRGGGAADLGRSPRRHANFDELPSFKAIVTALTAARKYLPAGLANWTRHEPRAPTAPIQGYDHAYAASSGQDFIVVITGVDKATTVRTRAASSIDVRGPSTGRILEHLELSAGETFTLKGAGPLVLVGRRK